MKIKKNIIKQKNKLLKLKLIKTKIYKSKPYNNNLLSIEDIEYRLKKSLQIIYNYHIHNKKILFICDTFNFKEIKHILKNTKHSVISEILWKRKKKLSNNNSISQILLKLKRKHDLVVFINEKLNKEIFKENHNFKIPSICFNNNLNFKSYYTIPGNFIYSNKKIRNNLLCSLLISIILKSK